MSFLLTTAVNLTTFLLIFQLASREQNQNAGATRNTLAESALSPSQIFSTASSSVVVIVASTRNKQALGSGFIISQNRIVTNHHVVEEMNEASVVFSNGKVLPVSDVIYDSAEQDLIVLGVETEQRRPLILGDDLSLLEGDTVYAIGAPRGLELSFTNGIVSAFRRADSQFLIQTTVPIAPGSSGGPLLDNTGRVVGVTTSRVTDAPGIYFSIGIGDVKRLVRTPTGATLTFKEWADTGEEGKPSLEQTLVWMSDFSTRHGKYTRRGFQRSNSFRQDRGCEAHVEHSARNEDASWNQLDSFKLGDLDPEHIVVSVSDPTVNFFARGNDFHIHRKQLLRDGDIPRESELHSDYLTFDSQGNAKRFAAALGHAITLCGDVRKSF